MAVRKKKEKQIKELPGKLDKLVKRGMTAAVLQKKFDEIKREHSAEIKNYIENNDDDFDVDASKKFETEYGGITYRLLAAKPDIDKDVILEAIEKGNVAIETLIAMAAFKADDLIKIGLESAVEEVDDSQKKYTIALSPSKEFAEEVESAWADSGKEKPKKEVVAPPKKARAARKTKPSSADLAEILGCDDE